MRTEDDAALEGLRADQFVPLDAKWSSTERLRSSWLWLIGLLGAAMVVCAVVLETAIDVDAIWSDVLLNLGSGVVLFSVLFLAERRVVVKEISRQTQQIVTAIQEGDNPYLHEAAGGDPAATLRRLSDDGQVGVATHFVGDLARGDYESAWQAADDDWRLCRIQAWLWNNREHFGNEEAQWGRLAIAIGDATSTSAARRAFLESEREQYLNVWSGLDLDLYGVATHRRIVAPGYEVVLLVPLTGYPNGVIIQRETIIRGAITILMHWVDGRWRVAALDSEAAPRPGWPPSWWIRHDPAAKAWFDEQGIA